MEVIFTKDKVADTAIITPIERPEGGSFPATLQVDGALGTDVITITLIGIDGSTETDAYDADEATLTLTATKPLYTFFGPANIKISKPVTTNDVGLILV